MLKLYRIFRLENKVAYRLKKKINFGREARGDVSS